MLSPESLSPPGRRVCVFSRVCVCTWAHGMLGAHTSSVGLSRISQSPSPAFAPANGLLLNPGHTPGSRLLLGPS